MVFRVVCVVCVDLDTGCTVSTGAIFDSNLTSQFEFRLPPIPHVPGHTTAKISLWGLERGALEGCMSCDGNGVPHPAYS